MISLEFVVQGEEARRRGGEASDSLVAVRVNVAGDGRHGKRRVGR